MYAGERDRRAVTGHPLVCAPRVDYEDFAEYVALYSAMQDKYTEVIERVVALRTHNDHPRPGASRFPFFTQRDLMLVGLAEFDDIRKPGLACALRLTRQRGRRFAVMLNEMIIEAVTTACRTYVNTIAGLQLLHAHIGIPVNYRMMTGLMVDSMYRVSGQCETHIGLIGINLFDANFVQWVVADHRLVNVSRHALPVFMLAFAMISHARLGTQPHLGDDMLRIVYRHMH